LAFLRLFGLPNWRYHLDWHHTMMKKTLERFRKLLLDYADTARGTASGLETQARMPNGGEASGNLSNVPMHLGDLGTGMYNQELSATLLAHEEHVLLEIDMALTRIDNGTYGRCENCAKTIPVGRLEALPYARYCAQCSEELGDATPANLNAGRPTDSDESTDMLRERHLTSETTNGDVGTDEVPMADREPKRRPVDRHAVGTAGGGTAIGGLAGTNIGEGSVDTADLEEATANGVFDQEVDSDDEEAFSGRTGGAVGGTPAGKRARGGRSKKAD
jgi:RNA polymerase-binding transcription factor DksA